MMSVVPVAKIEVGRRFRRWLGDWLVPGEGNGCVATVFSSL